MSLFALAISISACKKNTLPEKVTQYDTAPHEKSSTLSIANKISYHDVTVSGTPYTIFGVSVASPESSAYTSGGKPSEITAIPLGNSEIAVAWQDQTGVSDARDIHITTINTTSHAVVNDIRHRIPYDPTYPSKRENKILGFTSITDGSNDFAIAYADYSIRKDANKDGGEFVVVRLHGDGSTVWTQRNVLGTLPIDPIVVGSKLRPGYGAQGGSRILYADGVIATFFSHREQTAGAQHQAGLFSVIDAATGILYKTEKMYDKSAAGRIDLPYMPNPTDAAGNIVPVPDVAPASPYPTDQFLISHNFDERMLYDQTTSSFVTMSLGDAYPRAIPVFVHAKGATGINKKVRLINIKSGSGNETFTQLGGLVQTREGLAGSFTTRSERSGGMDVAVGYVIGGALRNISWLTAFTTEQAIHPKLAVLGQHLLVAWKLYNTDMTTSTFTAIVDSAGTILHGPERLDSSAISFNHTDDFFTYPNGDAGWVAGKGNGVLRVYKVKKD